MVPGYRYLYRLGDRGRHYRPDTADIPPGMLKNVIISNIVATASGNEGCSITGIPGAPVENIQLSNISIRVPGSRGQNRSPSEVPELIDEYPEGIMFGILPSYGLFLRHAENVSLNNVFLSFENEDNRTPIIADDVQGLRLSGIISQTGPETNECMQLIDCSRVEINTSSSSKQVPVFVRIKGAKSEYIEIASVLNANAIETFTISDGATRGAVVSPINKK